MDFDVQTPCYRAPEVLLGAGPVGNKIDVWSVGIVALELLLDGTGITLPGGIAGAELLRSPVDGRDAAVRRVIDLFGSVAACRHGIYWTDAYGELSMRWAWDAKRKTKIALGEQSGAVPGAVLRQLRNPALAAFLAGLLTVHPARRTAVPAALRHPFLTRTLLGTWGCVLADPAWYDGCAGDPDIADAATAAGGGAADAADAAGAADAGAGASVGAADGADNAGGMYEDDDDDEVNLV